MNESACSISGKSFLAKKPYILTIGFKSNYYLIKMLENSKMVRTFGELHYFLIGTKFLCCLPFNFSFK